MWGTTTVTVRSALLVAFQVGVHDQSSFGCLAYNKSANYRYFNVERSVDMLCLKLCVRTQSPESEATGQNLYYSTFSTSLRDAMVVQTSSRLVDFVVGRHSLLPGHFSLASKSLQWLVTCYLARVNANTTEEPPLFSYKRTTLLFCAKFSIPSLPNKQINGGRWIFGNN
uniref:Uncharacterized protein n=1 Tax=Glossina palpalis gambiensis TaxID=67801 RepID=A0A1B0BF22_9MUSC